MKKNWTMRVAVLVVALTLITSCFASGTYAKYVREGAASDTARVAKFGVGITGSSDLFSKKYEADDATYTLTVNTVESEDDWKVVAPGTTGTLAEFGLTGTPEVAVRVAFTINDFELSDNWMIDIDGDGEVDTFYCPIEITVDGESVYGLDYASAAAFEAAVEALTESATHDYAAGTDLSGADLDDFDVSWKWYFENENGTYIEQHDEWDTYLGDMAFFDNYATLKLEVGCTVTQID